MVIELHPGDYSEYIAPAADVSYEAALLGSILAGQQFHTLSRIQREIDLDDFADPRHAIIFNAAAEVDRDGQKVSPLSVYARLGAEAEKIGGSAYLHRLMAGWMPSDDPLFLAGQMRELRIRRDVGEFGRKLRQVETDLDLDPTRQVDLVRKWSEEITTTRKPAITGVDHGLEQLMDVAQYGEKAASPTPWKDLNEIIGGWYPGALIAIGARPGVGKSILAENAATEMARRGRRVLFCSLEMRQVEILQRTMAWMAKVQLTHLRRGAGWLSEHEWTDIHKAYPLIQSLPMDYVDDKRQTLDSIRAAAVESARLARQEGQQMGAIVIDYLQLITTQGRGRDRSRQQEVGELSRGLKIMAGEFDCPVIICSQLNRGPETRTGGTPLLSDFREAGDIEQDCDVALLLHQQMEEDHRGRMVETDQLDVIVAKHRNGPTGVVTLQKVGHYARLADY
jgi:replicative DNA helicase